MEPIASISQRSKLSDALKAAPTTHVMNALVPARRTALAKALPVQGTSVEVSDDARKLWMFYPSAVKNTDTYVRPSVLIEFGGRNSTLPQSTRAITPGIAEHVSDLVLPMAQMFYGETLVFETIVERLRELEAKINRIVRG